MSDAEEYRCFIGNLSWTTTDDSLEDAFSKFGKISDAKVVMDKFSGRSRGFGFVTFNEKEDMEEAIEKMNGGDLDGRSITVDRAQPGGGGGGGGRDRDRGGDRGGYDRGDRRGGDRGGDRRGGGGGGGGDCFKCGKPGHFARECPSAGGGGDRYGGRDDRYGGGGGGGGGGGRYSGGPDRNGGSRGGDRYSGGSRNGGGGGGGSRDRSGPYDRR